MLHRSANYRVTAVKPYYRDNDATFDLYLSRTLLLHEHEHNNDGNDTDYILPTLNTAVKKKRERLKESKNKPKASVDSSAFLLTKEEYDYNLAVSLRKEGKITTQGALFEESDKAEITALINNDVFRFERYDPSRHNAQIFKSRLVREVKGKESMPYEKSRLVI